MFPHLGENKTGECGQMQQGRSASKTGNTDSIARQWLKSSVNRRARVMINRQQNSPSTRQSSSHHCWFYNTQHTHARVLTGMQDLRQIKLWRLPMLEATSDAESVYLCTSLRYESVKLFKTTSQAVLEPYFHQYGVEISQICVELHIIKK